MTRPDDERLRAKLEDLERSAPTSALPALPRSPWSRRLVWAPVAAAVVAAGVLAGLLIAGPLNRDVAVSPSASASGVTLLPSPAPASPRQTPERIPPSPSTPEPSAPSPTEPTTAEWTAVQLGGNATVSEILAMDGRWVALGSADGRPAAWTSEDGRAWDPTGSVPLEPDRAGGIVGAARDGARVVAIAVIGFAATEASESRIYLSDDAGATWRQVAAPDAALISGVVAHDGGFTAVGRYGGGFFATEGAAVWRSVDGAEWAAIEAEALAGAAMSAVSRLDAALVAVGYEQRANADGSSAYTALSWRSEDGGRTWTKSPPSAALEQSSMSSVTVGPDGASLLAVGQGGLANADGRAWSSADGLGWSPVDIGDLSSAIFGDVAAGPAGYIAVGSWAAARQSDGEPWIGWTIESRDGVRWSAPAVMPAAGDVVLSGVPLTAVAVSRGGEEPPGVVVAGPGWMFHRP